MRLNRYFPFYVGCLSAIAALVFAPRASVAQEYLDRDTCQDIGGGGPEALGDREGHSITIGEYSCKIADGPLAGAIITGSNVWEWDGTKAKLLSGYGVARKPGSTDVFQAVDGNLELIMSEGKPTGWTASGTTVSVLTTGSAAPIKGRTVNWTAKPTGPHEFEITSTINK
jgi:hypothetical protein